MKSKKTKMNPAEALGKMQRAKKGIAVGSYLEGGRVMYKDGGFKRTAQELEDKGVYLEAKGGRKNQKRAERLYAKADKRS